MKSTELISNGIRTSYVSTPETASGLTVIFIHGFPFNKFSWEQQLKSLPAGIQGIAYDVRGFGESAPGHHFYSIDLFARDLHELISALRLTRVVLCGISMGGYIALRAMEQSADVIAGLVLCDTTSTADTNKAKLVRFSSIESILSGQKSAYASSSLKKLFSPTTAATHPEALDIIKTMIMETPDDVICSALLALASRTDTTPLLADIKVPVLIIQGEEDQIISIQQAEALKAGIQKSRLEIISGAGHLPNLEQPQVFNKLLRDFLSEIED